MAETILDAVADLGGPLLYLITFLLAFGETAAFLDFIVPGEVGLVVAGAAAEYGGEPLVVMILVGAAGATLGDSVSYWLGNRFGVQLVERWDFTRRRLLPKVERAQVYFERRGGAAVFFGRFVGALRAVVPLVAGTAEMRFRRFLVWNVAASLCWAGAVVSLGYFFGRSIAKGIDRLGFWISIVVVALLAAWLGIRRLRRGRAQRAGMGGPASMPPSTRNSAPEQ
jgi:membrane-associated protein